MASSVNYAYPVSGTVAPTAAQAANVNMVTASVVMADADTTAVINHNMSLSATQLTNLWPTVSVVQNAGGTPSPLLTVTRAANSVTLTKQSTAAGSGGTVEVTIQRPFSSIT